MTRDDRRHAAWSRAARRTAKRTELRQALDAIALDARPGHALSDADEDSVLDVAVWLTTRTEDARECARVLVLLLRGDE